MIQTLYGLVAMGMVAILTLTMNSSIHANESRMILNEVSGQVTNIANEFFDQMATLPYDPALFVYPNVTDRGLLADDQNFGTDNCQPDNHFRNCEVMNDLHGHTVERIVGGLTYEVEVALCYVDEDDPDSTPCPSNDPIDPTFSKHAVVIVRSLDLTLGDEPLTITFKRLFNYPRITG